MRIGMRLLLGYFFDCRHCRVVCALNICAGSQTGRA